MSLSVEQLEIIAEIVGAKFIIEQEFLYKNQKDSPVFQYKIVGTPHAYLGHNVYTDYKRALIVAIKYKISTL